MKNFLILIFSLIAFYSYGKENPTTHKKSASPDKMASNCSPATAETELNINNVRTTILAGGDMWWDLSNAKYEVPVGSGKHSIFSGSLWIGGVDAGGQIKVAAQTYRQTGVDWWPVDGYNRGRYSTSAVSDL